MMRWIPAIAAIVLLLAAAVCVANPGPGDELDTQLSLAECRAAALAASPTLREAAAAASEAAERAAEAGARRGPALGFGADYAYVSETMSHDLDFGAGTPPAVLEFGDGHTTDLRLGLSIPLYTGGALSGTYRAERAGRRAADHQTEAVRLQVIREVRRVFYVAMGLRAAVEADELLVARLARHRDEVGAAVALGAAAEEDRLRAESRLSRSEQQRLRTAASLDSAAVALGRLVGLTGSAVYPTGDLEESLLSGRDLSSERLAARPELASLDEQARRQAQMAAAARGGLLPRIEGEVAGHYGRPGIDSMSNEWMSYASVGVGLKWNLWDGGATGRRAGQARAAERRIEARRDDTFQMLTASRTAAGTILNAAESGLAEARRRLGLERKIHAMVAERYRQAAATESEYLDAQDDLGDAETQLALALTRVRLAEAALIGVLGY